MLLTSPYVGAVAVHHEGQIAVDRHVTGGTSRLLPLQRGQPLQILLKQHFVGELATGAVDGRGLSSLELDRPHRPRMFLLVRVNRAENGVVLDPPRLFADEALKRKSARGAVRPLGVNESLE